MKCIYEKASAIFAWLGVADNIDRKVMTLFNELERGLVFGQIHRCGSLTEWIDANLSWLHFESTDSKFWIHLIDFLGRPYFSRVWVLQELMFRKPRGNLFYGCGELTCYTTALWRSVHFLTPTSGYK